MNRSSRTRMFAMHGKKKLALCCQVLLLSSLALLAAGVVADDFEMVRSTIDSGGVIDSAGGAFELSGTIGQPDAGTMSGGNFELTGGMWFPLAEGDCNADGGVDLFDYDEFFECLTGPSMGPPVGDCRCYDANRSDTVDLADFALIQATFNG